jgi:RNA-dependent RNA polymerase
MVWADLSPEGCFDERCIRLAHLHNIAVDFPKTGIAAELHEDDRPKIFPDFMNRKTRDCYPSTKVRLSFLFGQLQLKMNIADF